MVNAYKGFVFSAADRVEHNEVFSKSQYAFNLTIFSRIVSLSYEVYDYDPVYYFWFD